MAVVLRLVLGFLVCALAYPTFVLFGRSPGAIGGAVWVATFTVGATVFVGVPLFAWFRGRGWLKSWQVVVGGAVAGAAASLPFLVTGWRGLLFFAAVFSAVGAAHALVFWLVAVFRNAALLPTSNTSSTGENAT